ncbi:MAG: tripartite tricarboxylate transporter substrate binding protein [Candidatus Anaerobiospirillum merdipullorum]|uniref:Tripartite tricarboxylate transporter substrate binding protein n=1 Tax=Candidatus Anaerobiospirillum merdipullorum TaxID=2838450 RepID=A0A9E2KQ83_9GAMM|nr:tripartite tricarboxylate transporter substrate binding protein [Candidatus Anaerobiospirillum merdipullorum]
MKKFATALTLAAALTVGAAPTAFAADAYPNQTINMICSHGAGGDTDYNTRLISRMLENRLGVSVVVNNVTGANGSIALTQYKDEKPDGYTLIGTNAMSLASNEASGLSDFGYDAFEVISVYGKQCGENLLVRADAPYNTLEELIAATQKDPDSITMGVAMGGSSYIAALIMQTTKDAKFAMVDAGGDGAERMTSLLGGHIDVTIAPYTLAKEYIESGKVKTLCTLMSERLPATPDVPTARESGVPDLVIDTLYVLLAPKGTPKEIVDKLNATVLDIVNNDAEYKEAIKNFNFQEPYALSVEDSIARLKEQREHMMSYSKYLQ